MPIIAAAWRWIRRDRLRTLLVALVLLALLAGAATLALGDSPLSPLQIGVRTVRVVAVGDMACDPTDPDNDPAAGRPGDNCRQKAVSDLAVGLHPDILLGLGDFQYELPTSAAYRTVYGPSYGRLRDRTVPVFGNQEYKVQDAKVFTEYFGARVVDPRGYWSQEIGQWHLVVLNSNCGAVAGGCAAGSPQQIWLAQDLADNDRPCVVAAWHHPRFSNGIGGVDTRTADLFRTLYDHRVELVLSGHDADYERFGPLDPDGHPDKRGVRQLVVGTGGQAHYRPGTADNARDERGDLRVRVGEPTSEFVDYDHHGVLELVLNPRSWQWRFHPLQGERPVTDTGEGTCH